MKFTSCPAFPFEDPRASHLMLDPLTGDAVIIAPGRRYRPDGTAITLSDPFSPAGLKHQNVLKIYTRGALPVYAVDNAYPIFHEDRPLEGRQEILVEGARSKPFTSFKVEEIAAVLSALQDRCRVFRQDARLACMVAFKNDGREAGASQPHPHSQIFGLPFVPDRLVEMSKRRAQVLKTFKMTAHAYLLSQATPARTIYRDRHSIAFADPVSRFSYGVRITLLRSIDNLTQAKPTELLSLAAALHALLPLVKQLGLDYNLYFHDVFKDAHECFEMRFSPRANLWGGFELDAGVVVNSVPAECAAAEYLAAKN